MKNGKGEPIMGEYKNFRKAAFAVGFGWTLGKLSGKFIYNLMLGVPLALERTLKKNADENSDTSEEEK